MNNTPILFARERTKHANYGELSDFLRRYAQAVSSNETPIKTIRDLTLEMYGSVDRKKLSNMRMAIFRLNRLNKKNS